MTSEIAERLFHSSVRLEKMFWIPGICAEAPRDFHDFIRDDLVEDYAPDVLEALPFLNQFVGGEPEAEDVLAEMAMHNKNGFICQIATPCPHDVRKDGSFSFSWGSYNTKWIYADTLEALTEISLKWASDIVEDARQKASA